MAPSTAWRATLYLGLASMVLLAALLMIGTQAGFTFSGLKDFMASGRELAHAELIGALLIAGFGTLISLFPFHSWAAPAYASAPAPVAMMHAGVLKKFGLYGLFMFQPLMETGFLPWTNILLVLLVVAAARDRHAAVTVVDEVLGGGEVPAERLAERFRVAVVPLVEQEELVALAERHAITEPRAGELVVKLHWPCLSLCGAFGRQSPMTVIAMTLFRFVLLRLSA